MGIPLPAMKIETLRKPRKVASQSSGVLGSLNRKHTT